MHFKGIAHLFLDNKNIAFSLRWNWGAVLLFVLIWSYGFENIRFDNSPIKSLLMMVFVVFTIASIIRVSGKYKNLYLEELKFSNSDIFVLCLYGMLLISFAAFCIYKLDFSLLGDQIYHAQSSQNQSLGIANWLIHKFEIPATTEYKTVVRLTSVAILGMLIYFIAFVRQYSLKDQVYLLVLLLLLLKLGHHYNDVHPPFRLFPLWLSSTLFGINDFSFRLVSLFALSIFAFVIYKFSNKYFGRLDSFLIGLAVCSIPLLLDVGSIVEQSIWTVLAWTFILLAIQESPHNPNYVRWITVIVIASLMRAPAFIALVPIFFSMCIQYLKANEYKNIRPYLTYAVPILVLLPFMWMQLSQGTPSTSGQLGKFSQLVSSFADGFSFKVMYYNIQMPWMLFLPFCLMPINRNWQSSSIYFAFFAFAYLIFYSIKPVLWGIPRYQAELWLPFVILGFFNVVILMANLKLRRIYISLGLVILILSNALSIARLNLSSLPVDKWKDYYEEVKTGEIRIWTDAVYNIRDALQAARMEGYTNSICKIGLTYETFSEVMNDYSIGEMESVRSNFPICGGLGSLNISRLNKNANIKLILFVDSPNKENEINQLISSGQWVIWKRFYNETYGSTIVGIIRRQI